MTDLWRTLFSVGLLTAGTVVAAALLYVAVLAGQRIEQRRARRGAPPADVQAARKERAVFAVAVVGAVVVYAAIFWGSWTGLTGFAEKQLGWTGKQKHIVPITLDGASVTFAFMAIRARLRKKPAPWAYPMVWLATGAGMFFNYSSGHEGHGQNAGLYLAFLNLAGICMFHAFAHQISDKDDQELPRRMPSFGMRWLTGPFSTVRAFWTWSNHPPAEGTPVTVRAALDHVHAVKEARRARRVALADKRHEERLAVRRRAAAAAALDEAMGPAAKRAAAKQAEAMFRAEEPEVDQQDEQPSAGAGAGAAGRPKAGIGAGAKPPARDDRPGDPPPPDARKLAYAAYAKLLDGGQPELSTTEIARRCGVGQPQGTRIRNDWIRRYAKERGHDEAWVAGMVARRGSGRGAAAVTGGAAAGREDEDLVAAG